MDQDQSAAGPELSDVPERNPEQVREEIVFSPRSARSMVRWTHQALSDLEGSSLPPRARCAVSRGGVSASAGRGMQ